MVSIIKNQLLKHLSRFCKNLSADKINLSTFKGEGELSNLQLDEIVLTELLELPSWLQLTQAWCNKVTFRIQWTKLKRVPIQLLLDEVHIEVETCTELRSMSSQGGLSSYVSAPGKYSYIHKIIDGITVAVNTVCVTFKSPAFMASVLMSRIKVVSVSPDFEPCELQRTRIKDTENGQLLIFKELVWQTVRIEAKSTKDPNLTPLRLLTNQARCRLVIKKRISDCFVMGSRLVLILDDLLWVLTDSQLKAALHFLDSLAGLVQKATEVTRKAKAARKLEVLPEYRAQISQQARVKDQTSDISKIFKRHDVIETSYHFLSQRIDLHLCDDPGDGRSCHPELTSEGGALQISVQNFQVDFYPYHLAIGDRKHWASYKDTNTTLTQWLEQALNSFRNTFMDLIDSGRPQHSVLARSHPVAQQASVNGSGESLLNSSSQQSQDAMKKNTSTQPSGNPVKNHVLNELAKLMTSCIILRVQDFSLYKVTTTKKQTVKEFISGDRDRYSLPEDMPIFHAEFTYYYYPGDSPFPLPPPKFYVQLNPIQINFDVDSCLWANSFVLNLYQSLLATKTDISSSNLMYIDVKIEAIMPRIIFECHTDHPNQRDRPKSLHIQISRALLTNVRSIEQASRADLAKCIDSCHSGSLFFGSEFPSRRSDFYVVTDKFLKHVASTDNVRPVPTSLSYNTMYDLSKQLSRELFWTEAKDVWCIHLDPIWGDFFGTRAVGNNRPIPFLDSFPLTLWVHMESLDTSSAYQESTSNEPCVADIHCLANVSNLVSVQINHYQYLFLLRLTEEISELATFLSFDSNRILKKKTGSSIVVGAVVPQVEISLIMPSQCPGKESSGGDLESVLPDSSSIADDLMTGGANQYQSTAASSFHMDSTESRKVTMFSNTPLNEVPSSVSVEFALAKDVQSVPNSVPKSSNEVPAGKTIPSQPFSNINIPKDINAGLNSMKKGFSNLMTSLDSALKPGLDDASDTTSIRSDVSSDSDNYFFVNVTEAGNTEYSDAMFRINDEPINVKAIAVEVASEVIEDENSITTPSEHSLASSYKRRDIVSMATFKLGKVEFIQQSRNFVSSLKIQISNIKCDECGSIPWDEFQNKFSSRSRAWIEKSIDNSAPCVKLRLDHEMKNIDIERANLSRNSFATLFTDNVEVKASNVFLQMAMSTLTGLGDLLEDEVIRPPLPVQVNLQNITLELNEDRPPSNITSPGPVPMIVNLSELNILRDDSGIIRIEPSSCSTVVSGQSQVSEELTRELQSLQVSSKQLKYDNDELKRRLSIFEKVSDENRHLRQSQEEMDTIRSCLSAAQEDIARLLNEKRAFLERIRELQDQLNYQDQGRNFSSKR